jgi:hypothetical protein
VVALSMAVTPWLAELGSIVAKKFSKQDIKALQPAEDEVCNHPLQALSVCRRNAALLCPRMRLAKKGIDSLCAGPACGVWVRWATYQVISSSQALAAWGKW